MEKELELVVWLGHQLGHFDLMQRQEN